MRLVSTNAQESMSGLDDSTRFRNVVTPHLDDAYRLAHWLTGNRSDAEDVVQEASLRAFRAIRDYAGGSARSWLLTKRTPRLRLTWPPACSRSARSRENCPIVPTPSNP